MQRNERCIRASAQQMRVHVSIAHTFNIVFDNRLKAARAKKKGPKKKETQEEASTVRKHAWREVGGTCSMHACALHGGCGGSSGGACTYENMEVHMHAWKR